MKRSLRAPRHWFDEAPVPLAASAGEPVFAALGALRRSLYSARVLRAAHPGVPVVVVGNLTAGGAGKTPLTIAIVQRLQKAGWTPGVATRGYGRTTTEPVWATADTDIASAGDEPVLIARHTGARVRVDANRARGARALAAAGCDVVVCDDGLQHYRLARDIEIEVIDGRRRYGNGRLIPAGPLREPPARGARCDFRVVNLAQGASGSEHGFGEWPMRLVADRVQPLAGVRALTLEALSGQRVHAVAGIGDPERFFSMLRGFGIAVVPHAFGDHHNYTPADLAFGSKLPVLMTEKDAVKIPLGRNSAFDTAQLFSVPVRAELPEAFWLAFLALLDGLRVEAADA